ncbi:MAG: hypothetical protein EOM59_05470 [Clostridia bacterium]|nr:hypothetical protein [Clostridia bacterium]
MEEIRKYSPSRLFETLQSAQRLDSPWGLCGVYFAGVLGVATLDYLPYTYLALFVPVIAVIYAVTGKFIFMEDKGKVEEDDI